MTVTLNSQILSCVQYRTLKGVIQGWPDIRFCEKARIAIAYATVSGIRSLLSAMSRDAFTESYWLVGLDDYITQPGALELIATIPSAKLRVVSSNDSRFRFHPKVYNFSMGSRHSNNVLIIGSNNLTHAALEGNAETFVTIKIGKTVTEDDVDVFWRSLWDHGRVLTESTLNDYRRSYNSKHIGVTAVPAVPPAARNSRVAILEYDDVELDPSLADTCWIECGYVTMMGKELEFKAEQALFFGLNPRGGPSKSFQFATSGRSIVTLTMKYQQNHMWRLQLNNQVPEVYTGLRPRLPDGSLGRSPYIAVFKRIATVALFEINFIHDNSREFTLLVTKSEALGAIGRTTARRYGWC